MPGGCKKKDEVRGCNQPMVSAHVLVLNFKVLVCAVLALAKEVGVVSDGCEAVRKETAETKV
jgi:hypothetical protein